MNYDELDSPMFHTDWFQGRRSFKGSYHICSCQPPWSCDQHQVNKLTFPCNILLKMAQLFLRKANYIFLCKLHWQRSRNELDILYSHIFIHGGCVAEWFVRWTTKLAIRVRSRVAAGLPTGYSGQGGNLTGYCCQQYRPRLDNRGGNGTHRGLCWK